ncbi:hypothetical protein E2C01_044664 [Portunus trituberculatus]|uniref:Uncharacterized protein n=1 Tax=Portunus trituberculatus TaxID=210409 RepID=A0A5B7FZY3_PORTR|nr:hypothetical protein [Portunus trituberculatus]
MTVRVEPHRAAPHLYRKPLRGMPRGWAGRRGPRSAAQPWDHFVRTRPPGHDGVSQERLSVTATGKVAARPGGSNDVILRLIVNHGNKGGTTLLCAILVVAAVPRVWAGWFITYHAVSGVWRVFPQQPSACCGAASPTVLLCGVPGREEASWCLIIEEAGERCLAAGFWVLRAPDDSRRTAAQVTCWKEGGGIQEGRGEEERRGGTVPCRC